MSDTEAGTWRSDAVAVSRYRRDGFLVLPRLTDDAGLGELRGIFDRLFRQRALVEAGDYFDIAGGPGAGREPTLPQIIHPEKYAPELLGTAHHRICLAIGARLLGEPSAGLEVFGHMILKSAGYGAETPWHQDEAYMDPRWETRGLSIWTPLDAATVESGCLHFIPGSHLGEVVPHYHIGHDPSVRGLATAPADKARAVAAPLAAGEASVHDCRTLHYAGPNRTGNSRRAYVLVLKAPSRLAVVPPARPWLAG